MVLIHPALCVLRGGISVFRTACQKDFMVKLIRAHGGCLGTGRRRRTRLAAISLGEPLNRRYHPGISEWGNPSGVIPGYR